MTQLLAALPQRIGVQIGRNPATGSVHRSESV
jgi:hypothetical protein